MKGGLATAVFFWSLLYAVPAARSAEPQEDREYREWARKEALMQARLWMLYNHGHLMIEGTVVDEEDKPVPEFTVEYPHAWNDEEIKKLDRAILTGGILGSGKVQADLPHTPEKVTSKTGRFQIDAKYVEINVISLTFKAKGYYETKMYLDFPISAEENKALDEAVTNSLKAKEWTLPKEVPIKKKFKVMMRKKGKQTKLERSLVDLEVNRKGDRSGYQFALPGRGKSGPVRLAAKEERFPPRSLFMSLKRDAKGSVLMDGDDYISAVVPAGAKLVLHSAAGDGFIRYQPVPLDTGDESIKYYQQPIQRGMPTAPETDYQPELSLSPEDLRSSEGIRFYFKCAGRYGRGQLVRVLEKDQSKSVFRLAVELQPDGSRNLETGE